MHIEICDEKLKHHPPEYLHAEKRYEKNSIDNKVLTCSDMYCYILFAFCIFLGKIYRFYPVYKIPTDYGDHYSTDIIDIDK
jgi:hypothetical protein